MKFFDDEYVVRLANGGGIRWYGLLIACAVVLAIWLTVREFKRRGLKADDVFDLIWVVVIGFIGARIYYVIWQWDSYKDNPISVLYIWNGGLAIYGGVIAGAIALYVYSRIKKYRFLELMDILVPVVALAQGIGRWGNYFNHEAYGMPVTDPKWQFFPFAVQIPVEHRVAQYASFEWFQATFFYESIACLAIFAILYLYRRRQKFTGELAAWYFLLYGLERSFVEGLRTDSLMWGPVRVSQALSVVLVIAAVVWLVCGYVKWAKQRNIDKEIAYE